MMMQILNIQIIVGLMLMAIGAVNWIAGMQKAERAMVDNVETEPPVSVSMEGPSLSHPPYAVTEQGHIKVSPERFQEAVNLVMSTVALGQADDPMFQEYARLRQAVLKAVANDSKD